MIVSFINPPMIKLFLYSCFFLFYCFCGLVINAQQNISRECKEVRLFEDEKGFVLHEVMTGETLYGISTCYGTTVEKLKKDNPDLTNDRIEIGQLIAIDPDDINKDLVHVIKIKKSANKVKSSTAGSVASNEKFTHIVSKGETLFAISQKYKLAQDSLKVWNGMSKGDIQIGQIIFLKRVNASAFPARQVIEKEPSVTEIAKNTSTTTSKASSAESKIPAATPAHKDSDNSSKVAEKKKVEPKDTKVSSDEICEEDKHLSGNENTGSPIYYKVKKTDNLFRIAQSNKVKVNDIKNWNNMPSDDLQLDQMIIVGYGSGKAVVPEIVASTSTVPAPPKVDTEMSYIEKIVEEQNQNFKTQYLELGGSPHANKSSKSIVPSTWMLGDISHDQNLFILHKTAPMHSIVKLRNPNNNKICYAKVIGPLPNIYENGKVDLKVTSGIVKKLNLRGKRFPLECTYYPNE